MGRAGSWAGALVLGLTVAGAAFAQEDERGRGDLNVFLRGGIAGYTGDLGALTGAGPSWGVTVNLQPTTLLGFEVGYEGSKNDVTDPRLLDDPSLYRHGASGLLKVAPPLLANEQVRPFVGLGLGASYVTVRGEDAGLYENDLMEEVPLVAGVEFNTGVLTAGFRTSYRLLVDEGFADPARAGDPGGDLLEANFTLGGRF
jgi:hypothetical protein